MPGVQGQERDAAEAGDDEPRHRGPQHEGAGGAVRQVSLNFYKHESSKFIYITKYRRMHCFRYSFYCSRLFFSIVMDTCHCIGSMNIFY